MHDGSMKPRSDLHPYLRLYSLLWWVILPFALLRLWWRGFKEPGYREHVAERLGSYSVKPASRLIWVHAVSVGETRAAEPLIQALLQNYPQHQLLLTHMTATGRSTGKSLFAHEPRVMQAFLPYDTLSMTQRFIAHFQPELGLLIETEVWPCLLASAHAAQVPLSLINARLSERSLRRARKFSTLLRTAASQLAFIGAQTNEDAKRLQSMGAHNISVTGNLKFDVSVPSAMLDAGRTLRAHLGPRKILLCASTREGEEALLLSGYMSATLPPDFLLLIVPRHPQRFDEVAKLFEDQGLRVMRRSQLAHEVLSAHVQVVVGDSMGEMFAYYAACDLAFIGGSLLPLGGQNLIEACACGKPVLIGPHTFNFAQASDDAVSRGAALRVYNAAQLFKTSFELLTDARLLSTMSEAAQDFANAEVGATQKTLELLIPLLN